MKKINIFRILFVILLGLIVFLALSNPKKTETNLLKAFFSNNAQDELLVNLNGIWNFALSLDTEKFHSDVKCSA